MPVCHRHAQTMQSAAFIPGHRDRGMSSPDSGAQSSNHGGSSKRVRRSMSLTLSFQARLCTKQAKEAQEKTEWHHGPKSHLRLLMPILPSALVPCSNRVRRSFRLGPGPRPSGCGWALCGRRAGAPSPPHGMPWDCTKSAIAPGAALRPRVCPGGAGPSGTIPRIPDLRHRRDPRASVARAPDRGSGNLSGRNALRARPVTVIPRLRLDALCYTA